MHSGLAAGGEAMQTGLGGGAMQTLSCSNGSVIKAVEAAGRRLDVDSYNALGPAVAGSVRVEGNRGLRANGESEISFARELPGGWHALDRDAVPAHFRRKGEEREWTPVEHN